MRRDLTTGGEQPLSGFVLLTEYSDFRSVPLPAELFDRRGVLRQQLEHPVHPVDVVAGRDDREALVPDPLRVLLQAGDDLSKIIAAGFESFDAAEIVKVAERQGNGGSNGSRYRVWNAWKTD